MTDTEADPAVGQADSAGQPGTAAEPPLAGGLAPLVDPGPELSVRDRARFHRHTILPQLGVDGQRRLRNARVLVIGAGGLGAPVLLYLTAAGVGTIGIIDDDVVEESNLHRQVIHAQSDVGRRKIDSARDAMLAIDSDTDVRLHGQRLTVDNAVDLFGEYDLILDGTDNFATRYLVNDAAALAHRPYVWGSIFRFSGQVSVFWEDAPGGRGINYRDLYPQPPEPGTVPSCAEGGVLGVLCAAVGSFMATETVKLITGTGHSLLGRLLVYDALEMSQRVIVIRKNPAAAPITALTDYDAFCGVGQAGSAGRSADGAAGEVPVIGPEDLAAALASAAGGGPGLELIDVREPDEQAIARIAGARPVPLALFEGGDPLADLDPQRTIVVYCKVGGRSAQAAARLIAAGHKNVASLAGGIDAWADAIDPEMQRY